MAASGTMQSRRRSSGVSARRAQAQQVLEPGRGIGDVAVVKAVAEQPHLGEGVEPVVAGAAPFGVGNDGGEGEPGPVRGAFQHHGLAQPEAVGEEGERIDLEGERVVEKAHGIGIVRAVFAQHCPNEIDRL
jgi:hypothetical protein